MEVLCVLAYVDALNFANKKPAQVSGFFDDLQLIAESLFYFGDKFR